MGPSLIRGIFVTFYLVHTVQVHAQTSTNDSITYNSLVDIFPALAGLKTDPPIAHPRPGLQHFPRCCLQAVNESYQIINGEVFNIPNKHINLTAPQLNSSQFPCGAKYEDDNDGAPEVWAPYSWCRANCDGWQRSSGKVLSEWVQPFVGFILPAAVFCLHVPRKFVLAIADKYFLNDFKSFPTKWKDFIVPLRALMQSVVKLVLLTLGLRKRPETPLRPQPLSQRRKSSVATLLPKSISIGTKFMKVITSFGALWWFLLVSTVSTIIRAAAAASIALLNTMIWVTIVFSTASPMILSGLYEASLDRNIIKDMRTSLMAAEAWREKDEIGRREDMIGRQEYEAERVHFFERVHHLYAVLVGNLILPKLQDAPSDYKKVNSVWDDVNTLVERKRVVKKQGGLEIRTTDYAESLAQHKEITATRLKGMLGCQVSFGAAVGAPIVFFLGSFLFSVISNYTALGENTTSHAVAFGMWWMTIPHVAIVSGCLLAGNNPNILEVIVIGAVDPKKHDMAMKRIGSGRWYQPFYDTAYTPVWMLERGRNKQQWIDRIVGIYPGREHTHDSRRRRRAFHLSWVDWLEIALIATILVVFPFILAFITSYYTPRIGLACRSLTFLLYFTFQVCYSMLWLWDFFSPHHIHYKPEQNQSAVSRWLYYILLGLVATGSCFTAVVGTVLQIVGVYRNCLCGIPVWHWARGDSYVVLSTNSKLAISLAREFWLPTGIASIVLLVTTCYGGWWYQRHWKQQFREVVDKLCRIEVGDEIIEGRVGDEMSEVRVQGSNGGLVLPTSRGILRPGSGAGSGVSSAPDEISSISPSVEGRIEYTIARKPVGGGVATT